MNVSVLSNPIVSVLVGSIDQILGKLLPFCDDASVPNLELLRRGDIGNPNEGKRVELSVHCFDRSTGTDIVRESIGSEGMMPVEPDAVFAALLVLSGEQERVTQSRREFMSCGKTLFCLPHINVPNTGPVHLIVSQNPDEKKRGQRPWAIRHVVGQQILIAQYGVVVTGKR